MFILASSSPRRKQLLSKLVDDFRIVSPDVDERALHLGPSELAAEESKIKAYAVASHYPDDEILACDTIVVLDGKVLGKPENEENAKEMLSSLSGRKHVVLSGYTYIGKGKEITRTVATDVYFNVLSEELIADYVAKKKPLDKAGSYGIQDGYPLVERIVGSYDNVMGLPTEDIAKFVFNRR